MAFGFRNRAPVADSLEELLGSVGMPKCECTPGNLPCLKTAEWLLVLSCGCDHAFCTKHKNFYQATVFEHAAKHGGLGCSDCRVIVTVDWKRI